MKKIQVQKAHGWWGVGKGLIGEKKAHPLLIRTRFGIHTFGMLFPIDVIVLDTRGTVIQVKKNIVPNRIFLWNPSYDTIIEFPIGIVAKKRIKKGDTIIIESI